jgi:hypothetical protein
MTRLSAHRNAGVRKEMGFLKFILYSLDATAIFVTSVGAAWLDCLSSEDSLSCLLWSSSWIGQRNQAERGKMMAHVTDCRGGRQLMRQRASKDHRL